MPENPVNLPLKIPDLVKQNNQIQYPVSDFDRLLAPYQNNGNKFVPSVVGGEQIDNSGRYPTYYPGIQNQENLYGLSQGTWSKFSNSFQKMIGIAGATFLEGTVGLVDGIGEAVTKGDITKLWDNEVNNSLTQWTNSLENARPVYYSEAQKNAPWYSGVVPFTENSANFWFDKVMKNLGFSIGAATGGLAWGTVLKGFGLTGALAKSGTNMEQFATGMEQTLAGVPKAQKSFAALDYLKGAASKLATPFKGADRGIVSFFGTAGEASIEAINNRDQFKTSLVEEFKNKYGYEASGEELAKIEDAANKVGQASYLLNIPLLTATNYIQFPRILNMSGKAERAIVKTAEKEGVKEVETQGIKRTVTGAFESALPKAGFAKKRYQAKSIAGLFFNSTEAFEEGAQNVIQEGTQDFFRKQYEGDPNNSFFSSLTDGAIKTLNSKEGLENILIGGLSGALQTSGFLPTSKVPGLNRVFGGESKLKERGFDGYGGERAKATAIALGKLNEATFSGKLKDAVDAFNRAQVLQSQRERAVKQGDILDSKDLERDFQFNYLLPRIKYGKFESVQQDIETYKNLAATQEGFEKLQREGYATQQDTKQSFLQRLSNFETHAKSVKNSYDYLNSKYATNPLFTDKVIDHLAYATSKIADYDDRLPQLSNNLLSKGIAVQDIVEAIYKGEEPTALVKAALAQIDATKDIHADDLKTDLQDIVEMSTRRREYLNEYNSLKDNPSQVKEKETKIEQTTNKEGKSTVTIKTKVGEKEFEIGKPYLLGKVVEYDENGKEVYRSPQLTILGENKDGTIKISTSTGEIRDISKSVLEDYKLVDPKIVESDTTANYFHKHWNTIFQYNFGKDFGGRKRGRLRYENKLGGEGSNLFFVYKNDKGEITEKELFRKHFIAQNGFKDARIKPVGELTATQKEANTKYLSEEEIKKEEETLTQAEKNDIRLNLLKELHDSTQSKLDETNKLINEKSNQLQKINEDLESLKEKGQKASAPRTKREIALEAKYPKMSAAYTRFSKVLKTIPLAISKLVKSKEDVEYDINKLKAQKEELQFNLSYIEDFRQNINETPENSKEFLSELETHVEWTRLLIVETAKNLSTLGRIQSGITDTIKELTKFLKDCFQKFSNDYPSYLKDGFDRIIETGGIVSEIPQIKEYIAEYTLIEDTQKEIKLNEEKIDEIQAKIDETYKDLLFLGKELSAKQAILDKFNAFIKKEKEKEAANKKVQNDTGLKANLSKAQKEGESEVIDEETKKDSEPKTDITRTPYASTERKYEKPSDHDNAHRRNQEFLLNISTKPKLQKLWDDNKIKILPVTAKTEKQLGLEGIIPKGKDKRTGKNYEDTTIRYVYVVDNEGVLSYLDKEGNPIPLPNVSNVIAGSGGVGGDVVQNSEYKGVTGTTSVNVKEKDGIIKATFTGTRSDKPNATIGASGYRYGGMAVKETLSDFEKDYGVKVDEIIDGVDIAEITVLEERAEVNPREGVGTDQSVTLRIRDTEGNTLNDVNIVTNKRKFTEQSPSKQESGDKASNVGVVEGSGGVVKVDLNTLVFTNAREDDLSYTDEKTGITEDSYTNKNKLTEEQIEDIKSQWKAQRETILGADITPENAAKNTLEFTISRGLPNIANTSDRNSVMDLGLITENDLLQGVITVPTFGDTTVKETNVKVNMPKGKPLFNWNGIMFFLNNRKFNSKEIKNIADLLTKVVSDKGIDSKIFSFLSTVLRNGEGRNAFRFDEDLNLHLSDKVIPFADIAKSKQLIEGTLAEMYHHVNNKVLLKNKPFTEITEKGDVEHPSYNHYLLLGAEPVLSTNLIVPQKGEIPIIQKYVIVEYNNVNIPKIVTNEPVEERKPLDLLNKGLKNIKSSAETKVEEASGDAMIDKVNNALKNIGKAIPSKTEPAKNEPVVDTSLTSKLNTALKKTFKPGNFNNKATRLTVKALNLKGSKGVELSEVKRMLPNVDIEMVSQLIEATGGMKAWGYALPHLITLYEGAPFGVGYHEAFEQVFNFILNDKQQLELYKEFLERKGSFQTFDGTFKTFNAATFEEAKEQMADEFAEFKATNKIPYAKKNTSNFFKRLWEFIKSLFNSSAQLNKVFKALNSGKYANSPINTPVNAQKQFSRKVENTPESLVQDFISGATAELFMTKWKDDAALISQLEDNVDEATKTLFDQLYIGLNKFFNEEGDETLSAYFHQQVLGGASEEELMDTYEKIQDIWNNNVTKQWGNYMEDMKSFLKVFGAAFEINDDGEVIFNDKFEEEDEKLGGADSYVSEDQMKINAKNNASAIVKLLFATIADSKFIFNQTKNLIGNRLKEEYIGNFTNRESNQMRLPNLAPYAKLFNYTLHNAANTNGLVNIYNKLRDKTKNRKIKINANLEILLDRLNYKGTFANLPKPTVKLLLKFEQALSRMKPEFFKQYLQKDGSVVHLSSNLSNATEQTTNEWINEMLGSKFTKNSLGKLTFLPGAIVADDFEFLDNLGIDFTKENYDNLPKEIKGKFNELVAAIKQNVKDYITKPIPTTDIKQGLGFSSRLQKLAEIYTQYVSGETTESQHRNLAGDNTTNFPLQNYISYILNDLDSVTTLEEFKKLLPQYNDLFMGSSYFLNNVLFKNGIRTTVKMPIGITEGLDTYTDAIIPSHKLTFAQRLLNEVNNNLNGVYFALVPADAKTPWGLQMGNLIDEDFFKDPEKGISKFTDIMWEALNNEILLAQDAENRKDIVDVGNRADKLRFFKGILSKGMVEKIQEIIDNKGQLDNSLREVFNKEVLEFVTNKANKTINTLESYKLIMPRGRYFTLFGIEKGFLNRITGENKKQYNVEEKTLNNLFLFREMNYVMNNIELHKMFFNDPAQYKDPLKRVKSFLSGRGYTHSGSNSDLNQWLDKNINPKHKKDWGYREHKNTFTAKTIKNVTVSNPEMAKLYSKYKNIDIADAQSWMTGVAHAESLFKSGRFDDNQEKLHNWLMAWERNRLFERGDITEKQYSKATQKTDSDILKEEIPLSHIQITKPIISGVRMDGGVAIQYLYKTSTAPLYLYFVEGTSMEKLYLDAMKKGIDFIAMSSAHKVGQTENNLVDFVDITKGDTVELNYRDFGIQVEISALADEQTQGSQLTKLAISDLLNQGVPIDVNMSFDQWNPLDEEEKEKSPIYKIVKRHNNALISLAIRRTENSFKKLDIQKGDFGYTIEDKTKVAEFILSEITRRELPNNIAEGIETTDGEFNSPLEANVNFTRIKQILYSTIKNGITKPTVNGGSKILLSSLGYGTTLVNGKEVVTNDKFKFYVDENGKRVCQIAITYPFGDETVSEFKDKREGYKAILKKLQSTKEGQELLRGIGFRIPTQGLNSVDHFEIVEFLPPQMGDVTIFPAEITTKAGSDFDIDKMSIYLKNYRLKKGVPTIVKFEDLQTEAQLKDYYEENILERYKRFRAKEKDKGAENSSGKILGEITGQILEETKLETVPSLEEFLLQNKGKSNYEINSKEALENEYFDVLGEILSLPENFKKLVKPNDAKQLSDISASIAGKDAPPEFSELLDSNYMLTVRAMYMASKSDVGIAAVSNTNHAVNQSANLVIYPEQKEIERNFKLRLKHNSTKTGGISLSNVFNTSKDYISDLISQVIDGTVDVSKNPWLPKLVRNSKNLNAFLFLLKAGADPEQAALFINQPAVVKFIKRQDIAENSSLFNKKVSKNYPGTTRNNMIKEIVGNTEKKKAAFFTTKVSGNYTNLRELINIDYEDLTKEQKLEQLHLLDDWFTVAYRLSNNLFTVVNGTNFDTARLTSPEEAFDKEMDYQEALSLSNVSGVERMLNNTFIGSVKQGVNQVSQGINSLFSTNKGEARKVLNKARLDMRRQFFKKDVRIKYQQKAQASLFDYLIDTQAVYKGYPLQDWNKRMFLNEGNIAEWIKEIQTKIITNPILNNLEAVISKTANSYVKLKEQDYDTYTSNNWTAAFKELMDSGIAVTVGKDTRTVSEIFNHLLVSQILQNGTGRNKNSFLHLMPNKAFAVLVNETLKNLQGNMDHWYNEGLFYRNNWTDRTLVSEVDKTYSEWENPETQTIESSFEPKRELAALAKRIGTDLLTPKSFDYNSKRFIKLTDGDNVSLYKRVDFPNGNPLAIGERNDFVVFKLVNKLGNENLKEYYTDKVSSILEPAIQELSDAEIIQAIKDAGDIIYDRYPQKINLSEDFEEPKKEVSVNLKPGNCKS